jgi:outer membrane immunogenic protein
MTFLCRVSAPVPNKVRIAVAARRRKLLCAAAVAALTAMGAAPALAADWLDNTLRGTIANNAPVRWEGVNFGATMGLSNMTTNFGSSTSTLVAYSLRNTTVENEFSPSSWTALPTNTTNGRQYSLFLGYSMQWNELVLGFDGSYNKPSTLEASARDSIARQVTTSSLVNEALTITAQSQLKLVDYATLRARAGYAMGQFLPYAVVGAAVGRFNYATTATVHDVGTPLAGSTVTAFNTFDTQTSAKDGVVVGGFLVGLGMDIAIFPNVFLRGEWEYVGFAPVNGIRAGVNTGRLGVGLRF